MSGWSFSDRPCRLEMKWKDIVITLVKTHSLLAKMTSKLTNIETKNSSLDTSLSQIEKKITAIWQIRDLNRVTSYGQVK